MIKLRDVTNNRIYDYSMTFGWKNKFQLTLLIMNIKLDQKIWSCVLIFDQSVQEDNSHFYVFSNNLTIFTFIRGMHLK